MSSCKSLVAALKSMWFSLLNAMSNLMIQFLTCVSYPASSGNTISIASVGVDSKSQPNPELDVSSFSPSNDKINFCGIGEDVISFNDQGGLMKGSGTSFAAAHVTGLVAALLDKKQKKNYYYTLDSLLENEQSGEDAHYKALGTHYKVLDAQYKSLDAHYKSLDAHYKSSDAQYKSSDAQDKVLEAHYKALEAHYKALDALLEEQTSGETDCYNGLNFLSRNAECNKNRRRMKELLNFLKDNFVIDVVSSEGNNKGKDNSTGEGFLTYLSETEFKDTMKEFKGSEIVDDVVIVETTILNSLYDDTTSVGNNRTMGGRASGGGVIPILINDENKPSDG